MDNCKIIKVIIVDDHLMARDGLKVFLSIHDDIEVVGDTDSGQQALAVEENLKIHLLQSWYDVDDAASLRRLAEEVMNGSPQAARHSRRYIRQHAAKNWLK